MMYLINKTLKKLHTHTHTFNLLLWNYILLRKYSTDSFSSEPLLTGCLTQTIFELGFCLQFYNI